MVIVWRFVQPKGQLGAQGDLLKACCPLPSLGSFDPFHFQV
jgi:hypothetical protein